MANSQPPTRLGRASPPDPEECEEYGCSEECDGRHDTVHIDCGPDEVFEELERHGVVVTRTAPGPVPAPVRAPERPTPDISDHLAAALGRAGVDPEDTEALVSAAAVGLVAEAWREGLEEATGAAEREPAEAMREAERGSSEGRRGPSAGEVFAQSVDLYRRAREALVAAREDGPDALLAFRAVAADVDLRWAGGSRFSLRSAALPTEEFVEHVDDFVRHTAQVMREHGWRAGLLHRALTAAVTAPTYFGMPGWPDAVATAMKRLAALDRSDAPAEFAELTELTDVERTLLEAPDRLGALALDWMCGHGLFTAEAAR
ncbi:hypothetical protein ABZ896_46255, partial [Streptomyces sp. NPDC047072]